MENAGTDGTFTEFHGRRVNVPSVPAFMGQDTPGWAAVLQLDFLNSCDNNPHVFALPKAAHVRGLRNLSILLSHLRARAGTAPPAQSPYRIPRFHRSRRAGRQSRRRSRLRIPETAPEHADPQLRRQARREQQPGPRFLWRQRPTPRHRTGKRKPHSPGKPPHPIHQLPERPSHHHHQRPPDRLAHSLLDLLQRVFHLVPDRHVDLRRLSLARLPPALSPGALCFCARLWLLHSAIRRHEVKRCTNGSAIRIF